MNTPSMIKVVIKDLIDFLAIFLLSTMATLSIYHYSPAMIKVKLSIYFFEQFLELFFLNPALVVWFLALSFLLTILYYLFFASVIHNTPGAWLLGLKLVDQKTLAPIGIKHALYLAIGGYLGCLVFFISPIVAWWLDPQHRGWSLKLAGALLVKERATSRAA